MAHMRSQEELPHVRGQGQQLGGATPRPRRGGCAGTGEPRGATYSTFKVRRGGSEEIPLVQGKEQLLCFAGTAVKRPHVQGKRNPSKTVGVARGHQRADTLKP